MKTKLLFLCFLLGQIGIAQNINFSDPELKAFLVNAWIDYSEYPDPYEIYPPIDTNGDGEISQVEALNVVGLNFSYLFISNLEGLEYFTNIKRITSYCTNFTTFNQPTLVNLEQLVLYDFCGTNTLTSINLAANTNLKKFECVNNAILSLNFSSNILLEEITISCLELNEVNFSNLSNLKILRYNGKLPTIDLSDAINLLSFNSQGSSDSFDYPEENLLSEIDLSNQTKLIYLELTGNNLTSLDLSNCLNLEQISISNNKISNLNIDNVKYVKYLSCDNNLITSLNVDNIFNLKTLFCKNNLLTSLSTKNEIIEEFINFSGNPNLESVCCDDNEVVYIQNQCLLNGNDIAIVNANCSEVIEQGKLAMYPNPVIDKLHLDSNKKINKIEILAMNGLMVMNKESETAVIDIQQLQAGIYFIKVYYNNEVSTMKFVKL